jgi:hypothetical protein
MALHSGREKNRMRHEVLATLVGRRANQIGLNEAENDPMDCSQHMRLKREQAREFPKGSE